jgi:predicted enzyme related to lactoylglutathione lyase
MITREEAIEQYKRNGEEGWINLLEMVFDGKPEGIEIRDVWPKYAEMQIYYEGSDKIFQNLVNKICFISTKTCQKCGKSGRRAEVDGWEMILCDEHFHAAETSNKETWNWFDPEDKTSTNQKIGGIYILVDDYDKANTFYKEKLEFVWGWNETVYYTKQGVAVAPMDHHLSPSFILLKAETPEELALIGKQTNERSALLIYTDNLDLYFSRLVERGVQIIREPIEQEWGKEAVIADLYGNVLKIVEDKHNW